MKKVETLTREQEEKIIVYEDKWLSNGYNVTPLNKEKTIESVKWLYEFKGLKTPYMWFCDSPLQAQLLINILKANLGANLGVNLWANFGANLWANFGANLGANLGVNLGVNLWANLRANLRANLETNLGDNLGDNLRANLRANLRDNLGDNLRANLRDNLRDNLWDNLWDNLVINFRDNLGANLWDNLGNNLEFEYFFSPQTESSWVGFYDFILNEIFPSEKEKFKVFNEKCINFYKNTFLIIPFGDICFISERPRYIKTTRNERGLNVLHCEDGPCVSFTDGYEFYSLNGVRVTKDLVMTDAKNLDSSIILKEKNADIRREIVRKIGNEKLCLDLNAKCIDKSLDGMYELLSLDLQDGRMRPFLKMMNPSIGVYHIEGVHPNCKTIEDALFFRNGTKSTPIKLT